ncbi:hypothetical protein C6Y53_10220 [Pukyongiella litopenaei]|uniref:Uncharacterized protein n=1 Tax=Pukyongiella litopenaei TaxID=2605946 RepID=A0A2S0MV20_9RHOB|nr:hypothetical protein C6Y53_10220 [Pukyongiella litopenaei]
MAAGDTTGDTTDSGAGLRIELNAAEQRDDACLLTFVVENRQDGDIDRAVYETVLFDTEGRVDRLTLFNFADLPAGRVRVRQFAVPELSCASLGRVLINGVSSCEAGDTGADACDGALELDSRTAIEVLG